MAVSINADAEKFTRTISLGNVSEWTVTCWIKLASSRGGASQVPWQIDNGSGGNFFRLNFHNGTQATFQTAGSAWFGLFGLTVTFGTWYFVGISGTATPGQEQARTVHRPDGSTTWGGTALAQAATTFSAQTLRLGGADTTTQYIDGSMAAVKIWAAGLTREEMMAESWTVVPQRTSGLRAWYPWIRPEATDYSGNGWTLTAGTAIEDLAPGPGLPWGPGRRRIVIPAAPPPPVTPTFRSASQVASGTAGSFACAKPAGVVAGDVLVAFHSADVGALANMGTPSGGATWSLLASRARDDGTGAGTKVWWKVAGASEPASYTFTQDSGADGSVSIVAVQGGATTTPVVAQTGGTAAGTAKATPSTAGQAGDLEIRCVAIHTPGSAVTWTPPAGFTERTDNQSGTFAGTTTATRALAAGGATGVHNFTASASFSEWHGFTVNIAAPVIPAQGTLTGSLPALAGAATGVVEASGAIAAALPPLTAAAAGTVETSGTLTGVLPALTADLDGQLDSSALTGMLPPLTASMAGTLTADGALAATLPTLSGVILSEVEIPTHDITVTSSGPVRGWAAGTPGSGWDATTPGAGWSSRPSARSWETAGPARRWGASPPTA